MIPTSLQRPRLINRINDPYLAPVTIITAPAGYGKSTLAEQWANSRQHGVGVVTLYEESNTPGRFLTQVLEGIRAAAPGVESPDPDTPILDIIVNSLEAISRAGREITIILDDYHLIKNQDVHDDMNAYLPFMPKGVHAIILSRTQPPLSLGRLRAHGKLRHLTEADLRFTSDEVEDLGLGNSLSAEQTSILTSRTDGWIAGIQLALTSLETPGDHRHKRFQSAIESLSEQQWLNDYIIEEVLDYLPPDLRRFVLGTSILTSLDPDLCDAVLEIDSSKVFLHDLVRRIVFVTPARTPGSPLAYHRLFAECVERISRRHYSATRRREQHLRAARWYEQQFRLELAIDHAISAEAWDFAKDLMTQVCQQLINSDLMHSALFWLKKLPIRQRRGNARLAYWYLKALQHTGQLREASRELEILKPQWEQSPEPRIHGYLATASALFAIFDGDDELALFHLYQTLHFMPQDEIVERFYAWSVLHQFEFLRGHDDVAEQAFQQAAHCHAFLPQGPGWWVHQVEMDRANHRALRADLVTAEQLYRFQLDTFPAGSRSFEAKIRYRLAAIYLEWNDLDRAMVEAEHVREGLERFPLYAWYPEALLVIAQVYAVHGDLQQAEACLEQVNALYQEHGGENTLHRLHALVASWWVVNGKIGLVREWANRLPENDQEWVRIYGEGDTRTPRIQLLIAEQSPKEASELAQRCIAGARQINHIASLVTFHIWEAVAQLAMNNEEKATESLRTALRYGAEGNFIRSFHTPGHNLRPLLRNIRTGQLPSDADYINRILASMPGGTSAIQQDTPEIINPLTNREYEVLDLLHKGYSNQNIAAKLYVTERTAKKHVGNILAKLDVSNRTSAVTRARKIGLLT